MSGAKATCGLSPKEVELWPLAKGEALWPKSFLKRKRSAASFFMTKIKRRCQCELDLACVIFADVPHCWSLLRASGSPRVAVLLAARLVLLIFSCGWPSYFKGRHRGGWASYFCRLGFSLGACRKVRWWCFEHFMDVMVARASRKKHSKGWAHIQHELIACLMRGQTKVRRAFNLNST